MTSSSEKGSKVTFISGADNASEQTGVDVAYVFAEGPSQKHLGTLMQQFAGRVFMVSADQIPAAMTDIEQSLVNRKGVAVICDCDSGINGGVFKQLKAIEERTKMGSRRVIVGNKRSVDVRRSLKDQNLDPRGFRYEKQRQVPSTADAIERIFENEASVGAKY